MKLRVTITCIVSMLLFGACTSLKEMARSYIVDEEYDEFERQCVYEQRYNRNGEFDFKMDFLNTRIINPIDDEAEFQLVVYKEGSDVWLFTDQPLQILADGELIEFPFITSRSNVLAASNVQKWGYYAATREQVDQLLSAQEVRSKVFTTEGYYNVEYKSPLLNRIREFMGSYADRTCTPI